MKSTGIVRKVDQLGRIIAPAGVRKSLGISIGDPLEIFVEGDKIILRKYQVNRACAITGEILAENTESNHIKGLYLSPKGAELLLEELQFNLKR